VRGDNRTMGNTANWLTLRVWLADVLSRPRHSQRTLRRDLVTTSSARPLRGAKHVSSR